MRRLWLVGLVGALGCGDNALSPRLDVVTALPAGTQDVAFDHDDVAFARGSDGTVRRFDQRWRRIEMAGAHASDLGTDNAGALLVTSSDPRVVLRLDAGAMSVVGGSVVGTAVDMPVQVPSGNFYVREVGGAQRSFVLTAGSTTWVETPPMFVARPVRNYDGTLYTATADGVVRFEANGQRAIAVWCWAQLEQDKCSDLVLAGADAEGRIIVGGARGMSLVSDVTVERVALPSGFVPVRAVAGAAVTVIVAKKPAMNPANEPYALFALTDGALERIESPDDMPSASTRLAVDHTGTVYVATRSLSKVVR